LILYYITDRLQLADDETSRQRRLLEKISEAARAGVDYIQLREKDLTVRELERLAAEAVGWLRGTRTKLLINSRVDVAIASRAVGVHLRSNDIAASEARAIWAKSTGRPDYVIGVSCHSINDLAGAEEHGADFAVFGPVFGKQGSPEPPVGLEALRAVARRGLPPTESSGMPVLALGGVTPENSRACMDAGAAGIAGIRLFQDNNIAQLVKCLR
jgi:thiamine-phosphate pyrophosphorylase